MGNHESKRYYRIENVVSREKQNNNFLSARKYILEKKVICILENKLKSNIRNIIHQTF